MFCTYSQFHVGTFPAFVANLEKLLLFIVLFSIFLIPHSGWG